MGYTNVSRLYKGIIGYEQWLLASNNNDNPSYAGRTITHNDNTDNNHLKQHISDGDDEYNDGNDNVVSVTTLTSSQSLTRNISEECNTTTTNTTPSSLFIGTNFVFDRRRLAVDPSYSKIDHALLLTTTNDGSVL
jgi:predicted sulfurtransferase